MPERESIKQAVTEPATISDSRLVICGIDLPSRRL